MVNYQKIETLDLKINLKKFISKKSIYFIPLRVEQLSNKNVYTEFKMTKKFDILKSERI